MNNLILNVCALSSDFRVNVMELDDLGPDNIDFNEDTRGKVWHEFIKKKKIFPLHYRTKRQ